MKKIPSLILTLGMAAFLTACSPAPERTAPNARTSADAPHAAAHSEKAASPHSPSIPAQGASVSPARSPDAPALSDAKPRSRILIAYFTWAENTRVAHPEAVNTDAVTSASVLMPGNVGLLAHWIQEETGGDTFSIRTKEPYSSDYDACLDRAIEEHDAGTRPALTGQVPDMKDYDIVFLGFPNWWYSCPMAILTFIEENDLSGKTIIPFCAHGTGGWAASLQDIEAALPEDCTMELGFDVYRPEVAGSRNRLRAWLSSLPLSPAV